MQKVINSWSSLVEVTGGEISRDKSWFYLIDYVWLKGKWISNDPETGLDLTAKDPSGANISLKRLLSTEPTNLLGVWFTPNGDNSKQIEVLRSEAVKWGACIRLGNPSSTEA